MVTRCPDVLVRHTEDWEQKVICACSDSARTDVPTHASLFKIARAFSL